MVKMSEILKRADQAKVKPEGEGISAAEQPQVLPPGFSPPPVQGEVETGPPPTIFKEGPKLLNEEDCLNLYTQTLGLVKDIYDKIKAGKEVAEEEKNIIMQIEKIVDQQYLGNDNILNLLNLKAESDFLYNHVLNVCIISIDIGIALGYTKAKLVELGTIVIEHDIGMVKFKDLYQQPRRLTEAEYKLIKSHPEAGVKIFKKFINMYEKAAVVISQEHERVDGSGYPAGLKGNAIDEYARIIGIADVYEAMSHRRPYRSEINKREVLKELIKEKHCFDKKITKFFIERIASPFPLNSCVELSSGEKGKVIKRNIRSPLRPVVKIIYDTTGEKLEPPKILDLISHPAVYIKKLSAPLGDGSASA
jgi:HD-GYP domain-containing protein (c-di-GMP phosphodiesterase class II)